MEPFLLTEKFLREKVLKQIKKPEMRRFIEEEEGLDLSEVTDLNLDHLRILNITCLWRFSSLNKLELSNNIIRRIEGLESLLNLTVLDLSFNHIDSIGGLNNLVNLYHLNLTYNKISGLGNMDNLKKLGTLLLRNNRIKSFSDITYLRQFEKLISLGIAENPVVKQNGSDLRIIATLPQLKCLDYKLLSHVQKQMAFNKFSVTEDDESISEISDGRKQIDIQEIGNDLSTLEEMKECQLLSYIDGLIHDQIFDVMVGNDTSGQLFINFPPVLHITKECRMNIQLVCHEWFVFGVKCNEDREQERKEFFGGVMSAKETILSTCQEKISRFITYKEQVLKELGSTYCKNENSFQVHAVKAKKECEEELEVLRQDLMELVALLVEFIIEMSRILHDELLKIDEKYEGGSQIYFKKIHDIDEMFSVELIDFYSKLFEKEVNYDIEIKDNKGKTMQLDSQFLQLMEEKKLAILILQRGPSLHAETLRERVMDLMAKSQSSVLSILHKIINSAILEYQKRVKEISFFINEQKHDLQNLFSALL